VIQERNMELGCGRYAGFCINERGYTKWVSQRFVLGRSSKLPTALRRRPVALLSLVPALSHLLAHQTHTHSLFGAFPRVLEKEPFPHRHSRPSFAEESPEEECGRIVNAK
jgi:hypothetical protein